MSDCFCIDVDVHDPADMIREESRRARKEHRCGECRKPIRKGDTYHYEFIGYDGEVSAHKTCSICKEIRDLLFCSGWEYGGVWASIRDYLESAHDSSVLDCALAKLSKPALDAYLDAVLERFMGKEPR